MQQKQRISMGLTVLVFIIIGLRFMGYRDMIPSQVVWGLIAIQLAVSYLWKPQTP
jgi:TM2 domain-containing membrane protein YozV